jgi:hypothetical protein
MSTSYNINILNNGEHYILAFEQNLGRNIIKSAISLYEQIDISIDLIDLNLSVDAKVKDFIKSICGRIIPYTTSKIYINTCTINEQEVEDNEATNIINRLKIDIKNIIDFYSIKNFWHGYTNDLVTLLNSTPKEETKKETKFIPEEDLYHFSTLDEFDKKILTEDYAAKGQIINSTPDTKHLNSVSSKKLASLENLEDLNSYKSYIIFNNIFNISLFITNTVSIKELCEEFTEFEIIETFNNANIIDGCKTFFHKKCFADKKDLIDKVSSFKKLYQIDSEVDKSEKDKVLSFLNNMYIISEDPTQKISATELYNIIGNHLCVGYNDKVSVRKRLTGYLIEMGLTKKRYSNGYYYYGVQLRYDNNTNQVSIDELMKKRESERELWIPVPTSSKLALSTVKKM